MSNSLEVRLEKLRFLAQEIEFAAQICRLAPSSDTARTMARRVLIRADDFVSHSEGIKRDILAAGGNYADLKRRRTNYAEEIDKHFSESRDKLAAHQQDIDYETRHLLWQDLDADKIAYLVEGARELYQDCIGAMGLPGFVDYESFHSVDDRELHELVSRGLSRPSVPGINVVASADVLAGTRPNTVASLNFTPVHQRAGQLALLRRWVRAGVRFLDVARDVEPLRRMLVAQLVTDIVSFADCLITRDNAGSKQALDGLDQLLKKDDAKPIHKYLQHYRFAETIERLRSHRNRIGAHLELDPAWSLNALLKSIDDLDVNDLFAFYHSLEQLFHEVCHRVIYLSIYAREEASLRGILGTTQPLAIAAYASTQVDASGPAAVQANTSHSEDDIDRSLRKWAESDTTDELVIQHFHYLLEHSPESERICKDGTRHFSFRTAHARLAHALQQAGDEQSCERLLALVQSQRAGFPSPLAEVLTRFMLHLGDVTSTGKSRCYVKALLILGDLPCHDEAWIGDLLEEHLKHPDNDVKRAAIVGLYRRAAVDYKPHTSESTAVDDVVRERLQRLPDDEQILTALTVGGLSVGGNRYLGFEQSEREYQAAATLCSAALERRFGTWSPKIVKTIAVGDFCGAALCVALDAQEDSPALAKLLLHAVAEGTILPSRHRDVRPQSLLNIASACFHTGDYEQAIHVASSVVNDYAHANPSLTVAALEILAVSEFNQVALATVVKQTLRTSVLSTDDRAKLEHLRDALTATKIS